MNEEELRESRYLVYRYSMEAGERLPPGSDAYPLGQVLRQNMTHLEMKTVADPWKRFFEPTQSTDTDRYEHAGNNTSVRYWLTGRLTLYRDPVTALIAVEAAKLREKWVKFQRGCSKEDKLDLDAFDPSLAGVEAMVREMHAKWQAKRRAGLGGKAAAMFHKFCGTLSGHTALLKILPEGSEYVSIFTGSLNAIIKASLQGESSTRPRPTVGNWAKLKPAGTACRLVRTTSISPRAFPKHSSPSATTSWSATLSLKSSARPPCWRKWLSCMLTFFFSFPASWTGS